MVDPTPDKRMEPEHCPIIPIPIGTRTAFGSIQAVGLTLGERYYWLVKGKDVAMVPASTLEPMYLESLQARRAPEPPAKGSHETPRLPHDRE